jgi:hypothetical protein
MPWLLYSGNPPVTNLKFGSHFQTQTLKQSVVLKSWALSAVKKMPFTYCPLCATGDGVLPCSRCKGTGRVTTSWGGRNIPLQFKESRCKMCHGQGKVPCVLCAGYELKLPPPKPVHDDLPGEQGTFFTNPLIDHKNGKQVLRHPQGWMVTRKGFA